MAVMRRGQTWSFVVWVPEGRSRRQVWRGGYRTSETRARLSAGSWSSSRTRALTGAPRRRGPRWRSSWPIGCLRARRRQPLDPDRISQLFRVATTAAGVPKIRLHDLRHTSAALRWRPACIRRWCPTTWCYLCSGVRTLWWWPLRRNLSSKRLVADPEDGA